MVAKRLLTGFFISALVVSATQADTDYRCLSACINDGKNSSACMKNCTYTPKQLLAPDASSKPDALKQQDAVKQLEAAKQAAALKPQGNKQFAPLISDTGQLLISNKPKSRQSANEDYSCIYPCLQNGSQYNFCRDKCTVKAQGSERQSDYHPTDNH